MHRGVPSVASASSSLSADDVEECQRIAGRKWRDQQNFVTVRPTTRMCTPVCQAPDTRDMLPVRWGGQSSVSHVVCNRSTRLDVFAVRWTTATTQTSDDQRADRGDEQQTCALQLVSTPAQPVLGCVLQMATYPTAASSPAERELLLVTSTSGFLSLLEFHTPPASVSSSSASSPSGVLRPLAHLRVGPGSRGGVGAGRRTMGSYLRVSPGGEAIAVASVDAVTSFRRPRASTGATAAAATAMGDEQKSDATNEEELVDVPTEGGILLFPVAPALSSPSRDASTATPTAKPNLQSPISIALHGTITAIQFLPPAPPSTSSRKDKHVRLLVALTPFASTSSMDLWSMRAGVDALLPQAYTAKRPLLPPASWQVAPELLLIDVDVTTGAVTKVNVPMQLHPREVISELQLVNPPAATATSTSSSAASAPACGCFVLVQLDDRLVLVDVDGTSSLRFPVSIPLPSESLPASCPMRWTWVGSDGDPGGPRLIGVAAETGHAHYLHLWWNRRPTSTHGAAGQEAPANSDQPEQWMRFVSLGMANPVSCVLGLSAPAPVQPAAASSSSPFPSSSSSPAGHFLLMAGDQADGMLARIDWSVIETALRNDEQQDPSATSRPPAANVDVAMEDASAAVPLTTAAASISSSAPTYLLPSSPALHRQAHAWPNYSELHDFLAIPSDALLRQPAATSTPQQQQSPHQGGGGGGKGKKAEEFLFLACGKGKHGTIRVVRPNTVPVELMGELPAAESGFHSLHTLSLPRSPGARASSSSSPSSSVALLSSFVGSTRVSAMREGALEDITEELTPYGLVADGTTIAAGIAESTSVRSMGNGGESRRALLQVVERGVRAIRIEGDTTDTLKGTGQPSLWSSSPSKVEHATIQGNFVLVSLSTAGASAPKKMIVLLLEYQCTDGRFIEVGRAHPSADVSCLHIATVQGRGAQASDLLCFAGTLDGNLHVLAAAAAAVTPTAATAGGDAATLHTQNIIPLRTFFPSDPDAAESVLFLSDSPSPSSSPKRFQLHVGLRDGSLLRASFFPGALHLHELVRDPLVRQFGATPLKLVQLTRGDEHGTTQHILAITDQAFLLQSHIGCAPSDSRNLRLYARELVFPFGSGVVPSSSSVALQFATGFPTSDDDDASGGGGVAAVMHGSLHLLDVDLRHDRMETCTTYEIEATPRRLLYDETTNLLCILTCEEARPSAAAPAAGASGIPRSQLLLFDPLVGRVIDRFVFGEAASSEDGAGGSSSSSMKHEVGRSFCFWDNQLSAGNAATNSSGGGGGSASSSAPMAVATAAAAPTMTRRLLVGTSSRNATNALSGTIYGFVLERRSPPSAVDHTPMDLSESTAASSSAAASSGESISSSYRLRLTHTLTTRNKQTTSVPGQLDAGVLSIVAVTPEFAVAAIGGRLAVVWINKDGVMKLPVIGRGLYGVPLRELSVDVATQMIAAADDKSGVTLHRFQRNVEHKAIPEIPMVHTDAQSRMTRGVVMFESESPLDYAANQSIHSAAAILPLQHVQLSRPASTSGAAAAAAAAVSSSVDGSSPPPLTGSPGTVRVLRMLGYDAFGTLFVLRREPPPSTTTTTTTDASSSGVKSSPTSAGAASGSSASTVEAASVSLVQESSFMLASVPSCIRQVRPDHRLPRELVAPPPSPSTEAAAPTTVKQESDTKMDISGPPDDMHPGPAAASLADAPDALGSVAFLVSSRLGFLHVVRDVSPSDSAWLEALQSQLSRSPWTRSLVSHHHASYRGAMGDATKDIMLDGELLAAFFLLTIDQQQAVTTKIPALQNTPLYRINQHLQQLLQFRGI